MAVPDFQTLMRPLLEEYAVGGERRIADVRAVLAKRLGLTEDELAERRTAQRPPLTAAVSRVRPTPRT